MATGLLTPTHLLILLPVLLLLVGASACPKQAARSSWDRMLHPAPAACFAR